MRQGKAVLKPFEGTLHSEEHLAWIEEGQQLQKAYRKRQRAWKRETGFPWPRKAEPIKPDPATLDLDDPEDG